MNQWIAKHLVYSIFDSSKSKFLSFLSLNTFMDMSQDHCTTILELKYASERGDLAQQTANCFPFRVSKS